jgi:hypothetical protein
MKYIPLDQGACHYVQLSLKNNKPGLDIKFKVCIITFVFNYAKQLIRTELFSTSI